jgi:hypothetical protein
MHKKAQRHRVELPASHAQAALSYCKTQHKLARQRPARSALTHVADPSAQLASAHQMTAGRSLRTVPSLARPAHFSARSATVAAPSADPRKQLRRKPEAYASLQAS